MSAALIQAGYSYNEETSVWTREGYAGIAYSDGDEVELRIASIIEGAKDRSVLSDELRPHCTDWPSLYHLSGTRANILRPFEDDLRGDILEIGAGCGAITRYLGECGGNVLALEGTPRRASIARARTRDLDNVTVVSDKFEDFQCDKKFDVVTLIGVLEYANLFTTSDNPTLSMLERVRTFLKPNGKLIIAIENQLGLKYFAGAPEDHIGVPMYGIEGRYRKDQPQTYGRKELGALIGKAGFASLDFLAPFPDYKLPVSIVTEHGFLCKEFDAAALAWQSVRKDPQLPSILAFSPELVWPTIVNNELALDLANSFLIVASRAESEVLVSSDTLAWHFTTDRRKEFCKITEFIEIEKNQVEVRYNRLDPSASNPVVVGVLQHYLPERDEYRRGNPLSREIMRAVTRDGWRIEDISHCLRDWLKFVAALAAEQGQPVDLSDPSSQLPGNFFDCIPQNIIVSNDGSFHVTDNEWVLNEKLEIGYLAFRSIWALLHTLKGFGRPEKQEVRTFYDLITSTMNGLGLSISHQNIVGWIEIEYSVQSEVAGRTIAFDGVINRLKNAVLPMVNLSQAVSERDGQIASLSQAVSERDGLIASLSQAVAERDAAVEQIVAMRASTSWRVTAPIRFFGHLVHGNFNIASRLVSHGLNRAIAFLPNPLISRMRGLRDRAFNLIGILPNSSANFPATSALVAERCKATSESITVDPMRAPPPANWPLIDVSVVTYNSERWVAGFINSLLALDYPKDRLSVRFVDNSSTDGTASALLAALPRLSETGFTVDVNHRPNRGFGAGHNAAIRSGTAPFCLVTNIDLTFEPDCLRRVVAMALADAPNAAAWELRQKPYEHPKFYDPVTGSTNWNAHACVLLRRSAIEAIGGYDETLFMYGEDVELSYRLRRNGYLLRYCPAATVWHFSYEASNQVKPLQYTGSTFSNLYLRLKYGKPTDIVALPIMSLRLLAAREVFPGSRWMVARSLLRLIAVAPKALMTRKASAAHFPFRTWDYEMIREGAFVEQKPLPTEQPLVSIITRTYRGRDLYLRQALMSGAHQTWSNLEQIVVEDGGDSMRNLCEEVANATGRTIRFIANGKLGRSNAGNTGLAAARGRWCVFLDDDDLLFADHVEVLVNALLCEPDAVASYTLAWEVPTDAAKLEQGSYIETSHMLPAVLHQNFDFEVLRHHNYFPIQSVLFERGLFDERGGFEEDMDALEDWVLWLRYALNNRFVYVPKVTSLFRTPVDPAKTAARQAAFDKAYPLAKVRANLVAIGGEGRGGITLANELR